MVYVPYSAFRELEAPSKLNNNPNYSLLSTHPCVYALQFSLERR